MVTCKNCIYNDACDNKLLTLTVIEYGECSRFKDKSRYIELPCKAGDTAYRITKLYNGETIIVEGMVFEFTITHESSQIDKYRFYFWAKADTNYTSRQYSKWCEFTDFGKTVFLTREEAEKALAERSNR